MRRLRDHVARLAVEEGPNTTGLARVKIYRSSETTACQPCLYDPALIFVAQGYKRSYLNGMSFLYGPGSYFVVTVPLPLEAEIIQASPEEPFLAVALSIDVVELGELILTLSNGDDRSLQTETGAYTAAMTERHEDALDRLLHSLDREQDARVLGPQICREIVYLTLIGEKGENLYSMARLHGASMRIATVLRAIHEEPQRSLDVSQMASMAQMSKSGFFVAFKAVTSMSPVQYQKSIRLHRARNLILNEGLLVSDAAYRVGYSAVAQFSRDYARFFEKTARQDIAESNGDVIAFS